MITDVIKTNFSFSQEELIQMGFQTVSLMSRDLEKFSEYGVNQTKVDELLIRVQAFADGTFDNEFLGIQMFKTEAKSKKSTELRILIREFMLKIELISNRKSIMFGQFRNVKLSELTDIELIFQARSTANIGLRYIDLLFEYGVTAVELENIDTLANELTQAIDERNIAIAERDIEARARTEKAVEIYSLLSTYRNLGRKMWLVSNEAKSNDYIMTGGMGSTTDNQSGDTQAPVDTGEDEFYPDNG